MEACFPSQAAGADSPVADALPGVAKYLSIVLTNPVAGREDEFNHWYTHEHIPDVLAIPGIVAATRYRQLAKGGEPAWGGFHYMAIYEIETNDLRGVFRTLLSRMGTAMMPISASMDRGRAFYDWEVLTPRLVASARPVRAKAKPPGGRKRSGGV